MLNGLELPQGFRRVIPAPEHEQPDVFAARHDFHMLWYDAFWRDGRVIAVCPKLFNFEHLLRGAHWQLDGRPVPPPRIRRRGRHDILIFRAPVCPQTLMIGFDGFSGQSPVARADPSGFAGLNTHVAISQDNDLCWIRDFARFHKQHHGLQAMLLFDNASTRYTPQEVAEALAPVGLEHVVVVPTPYLYGPRGRFKYLQTSVFEIARQRFLARARAVLVCDIDELVVTKGLSIFDAAVASRLGYVSVRGAWHYPGPEGQPPFSHADHFWHLPQPRDAKSKYCIVPQGPLRWVSWDVHKPELASFDRLVRRRDMSFLHCRAISTSWKGGNRQSVPKGIVENPRARAALTQVFDPQSQE